MSAWRENIERVREALNTAHPISGDDHDAVDASDAALTALTAQIEELERERDAAERMFAAAVYAMPDGEITVWPVHLEVSLTLERYDDPLNNCSRFRAALAQSDPPEDSE